MTNHQPHTGTIDTPRPLRVASRCIALVACIAAHVFACLITPHTRAQALHTVAPAPTPTPTPTPTPEPTDAAALSIDAIIDRVLLVGTPGSGSKPLTPDELTKFDQALRDAAQPDQPRLLIARSLLLRWLRKPSEALPLIKQAATLEPRNPTAHYHLGNCIFETISSDAGLGALSAADEARAALNKTIELEPGHIWARYALAQFYIQAPGIAGGSYRKARELAKQVLAMPEGRGQFLGHLMLGQVAEHDEDWSVMISEYELAEQSKGEGAIPSWPLSSLANALIRKKNDLARAKPVLARYAAVAPPDSTTLLFLTGEVARMEERWVEAIAAYEHVLELNPKAQQSAFALAECYEARGQRAKAAAQYALFAENFPKDERATSAKRKAAKLKM